MKHVIILGDGMADWAVPSLGDKTLLQYAHTPYMDKYGAYGRIEDGGRRLPSRK